MKYQIIDDIVEQKDGFNGGHRADVFGVELDGDALCNDVGQRKDIDRESNQGANECEQELVGFIVAD